MQAEFSKKNVNVAFQKVIVMFNDKLEQLYQEQMYISRRNNIWAMLQNSYTFMYQPIKLEGVFFCLFVFSHYWKHICLYTYEINARILKWWHWHAIFDNTELSMSVYCVMQLIIICNIESYGKNEEFFSFNEYAPINYLSVHYTNCRYLFLLKKKKLQPDISA